MVIPYGGFPPLGGGDAPFRKVILPALITTVIIIGCIAILKAVF